MPHRPRLAIIEDNNQTYLALTSLLRQQFNIIRAIDVSGGLALLDDSPAVVLLDLMLGHEDGLAVLRAIRERGLPIWVVVTTGIPEGPHMTATVEAGPDKILKKPYSPEDLDAALAPVLASSANR